MFEHKIYHIFDFHSIGQIPENPQKTPQTCIRHITRQLIVPEFMLLIAHLTANGANCVLFHCTSRLDPLLFGGNFA